MVQERCANADVKIALIDYDAGNLASVQNALAGMGAAFVRVAEPEALRSGGFSHVILPGVGAFGAAMNGLKKNAMDRALVRAVGEGMPLLGICLGMQLLFERSQESPGVAGLCLLEGECVAIPRLSGLKIPHMGWNTLDVAGNPPGFCDLPQNPAFYFVHTYHVVPQNAEIITATAAYGQPLCAMIARGKLWGAQCHPEKSGKVGLAWLQQFLDCTASY